MRVKTRDLSTRVISVHSQTRVTIPLSAQHTSIAPQRDSDTTLRMDNNDSSRKIISFYSHRSIFLALFDKIFMFYFSKKACFGSFSFESYFANDE